MTSGISAGRGGRLSLLLAAAVRAGDFDSFGISFWEFASRFSRAFRIIRSREIIRVFRDNSVGLLIGYARGSGALLIPGF